MTIRLAACGALLVLTGGACASGEDKDSAGAALTRPTEQASPVADSAAAGPIIRIKLIAFAPTDVRLAAGGTVTWQQDDVATHTVTSGRVEQSGGTVVAKPDGRFDSGNISKGASFQFSFPDAGEYPFFCAIHPATMTGVVAIT